MTLAELKHNKETVLAVLGKSSVARIAVNYWGSGDSGEIDDKEISSRSGDELKRLPKKAADSVVTVWSVVAGKYRTKYLGAAVEDLFYDCLDLRLPGWANGSTGTLELDVVAGRLCYTNRTDRGRERKGSI